MVGVCQLSVTNESDQLKCMSHNILSRIQCAYPSTIKIKTAFYGRKDKTTCQHADMDNDNCEADNFRGIVENT